MDSPRSIIAIVDDEDSVRRAIKRLISVAGFDVNIFGSGRDFLNSLKERQPQCVILDLHMPEMSGFDVQAELKNSGYTIPVIAMTGHDTPESRPRAMAAGAVAYVLKPVAANRLLGIIREVTNSH